MSNVVTKKAITSNLSAEKVCILLEKMSTLDQPVRLQDLSKLTDMNASTLLRFLAPLIERGYVAKTVDGSRYYLTLKLCGLANNIRTRLDLRTVALPHMRHLVQVFQETVNLSVENDMSVQYVEVLPGPNKMLISMQHIGHVAPMHCTGVGKLFLLEYEAEKIDRLIAAKGLPRFTERTITDRETLLKELKKVRRTGRAYDNGECEEGVRCVAVPVRNFAGDIVAGISVSGPSARMNDAFIEEHFPHLADAAAEVSFKLGWQDREA